MSHRNLPINPDDFTLIIDGRKTTIPAYDKETIKILNWDKYLNNRTGQFHREPERNKEYF